MKDETARREVVDTIVDIFRRNGAEEYLGEPVTMAEHMLQTAYFTAEAGGDDDAVIAALIHDIGHFTSELGSFAMNDIMDRMHEEAGAMLLEGVFPQIVIDCVQHHVAAKRYLCAVDAAYHNGLSDASKHSLKLQGGPMDDAECKAFEAIPILRRSSSSAAVMIRARCGAWRCRRWKTICRCFTALPDWLREGWRKAAAYTSCPSQNCSCARLRGVCADGRG